MDKPYSNPAVNSVALDIEGDIKAAMATLRTKLHELIAELNRDGQVIADDLFNVQRIRNLTARLLELTREAGFSRVLERQAQNVLTLAESILNEAGRAGLSSAFAETTGQAIEALMKGVQNEILVCESKIAGDLERLLLRTTLGGVQYDDIITNIGATLDINETQAIAKAQNALAGFHTLVRERHFQDNGVEWFLYEGPRDEINRPFCAHFVGTRVTAEILDAHADDFRRSDTLPPSISLGGYNCRHELVPLIDTAENMEIEVGPR